MSKIFLVDDEKQMVEYIKPFLEKRGFTVTTAATGQEAIENYGKENPDLVILDLGLPGINGRDVLKEIKQKRPEIMVMVISGYNDPQVKQELTSLGADHFLSKPILPTKLYELLKSVFEKNSAL